MFCPQCGASNVAGTAACARCGVALGAAPAVPGAPPPAGPPAGYPPSGSAPSAHAPPVFTGYAGFGKRFLALLVDVVIIFVLQVAVGMVLRLVSGAESMAAVQGFSLILNWLYYALQESSPAQATIGKRALGIKVVDLSGQRIGFGRASGRFFAKILSALVLLIGYIMAAFTEKKQALHDLLAGTLVVNR